MELIIILLLVIVLVVLLMLYNKLAQLLEAKTTKPTEPGDGDKPDLAIQKFQVTPGKDILHITVFGYHNDEDLKAKKEQRQPEVKVLYKFSLKTITSKNPKKLLAVPINLLIPKELLTRSVMKEPTMQTEEIPLKNNLFSNIAAPQDSIPTGPHNGPPSVYTGVEIETGNDESNNE